MRPIDANNLLWCFKKRMEIEGLRRRDDTYLKGICDCIKDLESRPTIELERKKGKWILSDEQRQEDVDNDNYRFICSECGKSDIHSKAVIVSFCWNCGADMGETE